MRKGAREYAEIDSVGAQEFAAEVAWRSPEGTAARLAAEAGEEDAFFVVLPAVRVLGPDFRDHIEGRAYPRDHDRRCVRMEFAADAEIVTRYLRRSPEHEWLILDCFPRDHGTACRRRIVEDDGITSARLRATLTTYAYRGDSDAIAALGRTLARGALRWFPHEFHTADEAGTFTPEWWGLLLYPGGLHPDDIATVDTDLTQIRQLLAEEPALLA